MANKTKAEAVVSAFKDLALFVKEKWRATLMAISFILFVLVIGLLTFYGYKRIDMMGTRLDEISPSPNDMQQLLMETNNQNKLIGKILEDNLTMAGGDRAYLIRFHNGQRDINGTHFMYMSMSNEVLVNGIGSGYENWQDVPTSLVPPERIDSLLNKECITMFPDNLEDADVLKKKMLSVGAKKIVICPINDIETGNLLGILGITWVAEFPSEEECFKVNGIIKAGADKLSAILSINN